MDMIGRLKFVIDFMSIMLIGYFILKLWIQKLLICVWAIMNKYQFVE
jgi:hypothetical protein